MEDSDVPQARFSTKVIFTFFGLSSLLGFNVLLTEMNFFDNYLREMNPSLVFNFLNYILNIPFQFLLLWKKDFLSLKTQLIIALVGSIIFLILIPLSTMSLGVNTKANKIVTGGLVLLMGFINALCSGGFYNLVSNFPLEMIVILTTCQAISGIVLNIIQYIILWSSGDGGDIVIQAWIFFGISILIIAISLFFLLISFNNEYFQYYLNKSKYKDAGDANNSLLEGETQPDDQFGIVQDKTPEKKGWFMELFKKIWDLDLLVVYLYIVTFALYPNASINQKVFEWSPPYSINTVIFVYNIFDTLGRVLVGKITPSKKLNTIVILGRSFLLFTVVFNYYCQDGLGWDPTLTTILLFINMAIFASTNGIGTTLCFALAPNEVEDKYKGQAGISISFFLIIGIFLGSLIAFITNAIISTFKKDP